MFRSMQKKVFAAMIAITMVAVLTATIVFYWKSSSMIETDYGENLYARVCQTGDSFDESMQDIYYLTVEASCDEKIQTYVGNYLMQQEQNVDQLTQILRDYSKRCSDLGSVYLWIPEDKVLVTSKDYPITKRNLTGEQIEEIKKISQNTMTPILIEDPVRTTSDILSFASPVLDAEGELIAYVMCNIEERTIYYKYLDALESQKTSDAILLGGEQTVASAQNQNKVGTRYENTNFTQMYQNGIQTSDDGKVMAVTYQTRFSGYWFCMETELSTVLADLRNMRYFLILILFVEVVIAAILAVFITREMNRPLRNLADAMEAVGEGNLDRRVEVISKDEIGILSKDFNQMLEHIQNLIGQLIKEETLKKNAELEALQYQITPHFMYNTLNSIKYSALLKGETETAGYVDDFVELLQASINKRGAFVTVAEELHFLKNYLNLQNMRYEEKIEIIYEIQAETQGCFLPRLILQPLVENAILHGLDLKNGNNQIKIKSDIVEGRLCMAIEDNGRGMSAEQLEKLVMVKEKKVRGMSGIGVANVQERLCLYYGDQGSIQYESNENGTTVRIYLPAYKEQEKYVI